MQTRLLIFDMDGVLVDVTESYRRTIAETVKLLTGTEIDNRDIQGFKNRGNSNNDWDLTFEIVRERGGTASKQEIIDAFQKIYLGNNYDGLIARERWLPRNGLLEKLTERFRFAMFTGRERWEACYTLSKFAPRISFDPIIGMDDVQQEKPHPEGLLKIIGDMPPREAFYVGDATDDCRAAAAAGVSFIGVVSEENPLRNDLESLFRREGARDVIKDINDLEHVLP
jgi:HAD superfamily hydrolase (TIGR01548 family)